MRCSTDIPGDIIRCRITFRILAALISVSRGKADIKADIPKHAINVAFGGKADMAYCSANVRL
jgi:hypothetical protein